MKQKSSPTELVDASEETDQRSSISEQHQVLFWQDTANTNTLDSFTSVRHAVRHLGMNVDCNVCIS